MKRFYTHAEAVAGEGGYGIHLDGKPVKTPRKHHLMLPTAALAEAVAAEWRAQTDEVRPASMPLTQMANGIADLTEEERQRLVAHMAGYIDGDMLYFREEGHADLYPRQEAEWEPWLRWAEQRYDLHFIRQTGIIPQAQPQAVHQRLSEVLACLPLAHLVPLNILATGFSSLLLGLAVYEQALPVEDAFALSLLEQRVQAERWGEDEEQQQRTAALRGELHAAARFLELLRAT